MRPDEKAQESVRYLLKALGTNQKQFAELCGLSQPVLSAALKLGGARGIREDSWERIVEGLERELAARTERLRLAGRLEKAQTVLAELRLLDPSGDRPYPPGGPMPIDASNYVERISDARFRQALTNNVPLIFVVGYMQSGRSSLLARAEELAKKDSMEVIVADLNLGRQELKAGGESAALAVVAEALDLGVDAATSINSFVRAFSDRLDGGKKQRLALIIDNMDSLLLLDGGEDASTTLAMALGRIRKQASTLGNPFSRLVTICVFGGELWSLADGSSFMAAGLQITLGKLSPDLVAVQAHAELGRDLPPEAITRIFDLFHGHPYLTHLLLDDLRQGISLDDAEKAALQVGGAYRVHADRLYKRLRAALLPEERTFHPLLEEISLHNPSEPGRLVFRHDAALTYFGVLDANGTICSFYQAAARRVAEIARKDAEMS